MATAKQRAYIAFFKAKRKAGWTARSIGAAWRKSHGGSKARRNKSGRPLSGRKFRPALPKGPLSAVVTGAERSFRRASAAVVKRVKRRKGKKSYKKNSSHLSSARARSMAKRRWKKGGSKKKRYSRNVGGMSIRSIFSKFKSALTAKTAKAGLAVLAGAIAATGAPSLIPSWNVGWYGVGLSILAAAFAGVAATFVSPALLTDVASGGVVIVGLRLVGQFMPRLLRWSQNGVMAGMSGFLPPPRRGVALPGGAVAGYLPAPAAIAGKGRLGFARAAGESFKRSRI